MALRTEFEPKSYFGSTAGLGLDAGDMHDPAEPGEGSDQGDPASEESMGEAALPGDGRPPPPDRQWFERLIRWADPTKTINIAQEILQDHETFPDGDSLLGAIGMTVVRQYQIDEMSRDAWMRRTQIAMDFAMQIAKAKSMPWPGSSNIVYPLIATASIQFAARAYPAIVPGPDVVKGSIVGDDKGIPVMDEATGKQQIGADGKPVYAPLPAPQPGEKQKRADRIGRHMSWQLIDEQPEWDTDTDVLTHILPIVGCHFRKTYFDSVEGRNVSVGVSAKFVVVNYNAKSLETAPRITEIMKLYPFEIAEEERTDTFLKWTYGAPPDAQSDDEDAPHEFLEQHRRLDLDGDGYPEPYIVTVHKHTSKVVRIVARFDPDGVRVNKDTNKIQRIEPVHYFTKFDFLPNPDGGIYGTGFGQLLNPINDAVNTTLNQMFDAGTLANMGGGFIGKGISMQSGTVRFTPGEYKMVNALGATVRDSIVPLTFPGPSMVLFQLLGFLIQAAKEMASNTEVLSGNQSQSNVPATTTLALIEQGLKVFTAVYKRIFRALKSEFQKLFRLNRLYLNKESEYRRGEKWEPVYQEDYALGCAVEPVSDPAMVSDLQQLARAAVLKDFINDPRVDGAEIIRRIFEQAKIQDIDKLMVPSQPPDPLKVKALALQEIKVKSDAIKALAQAMLFLSQADAADAGVQNENAQTAVAIHGAGLAAGAQQQQVAGTKHKQSLDYFNAELEALRIRMEHLDDDLNPADAGPAGGGAPAKAKEPAAA